MQLYICQLARYWGKNMSVFKKTFILLTMILSSISFAKELQGELAFRYDNYTPVNGIPTYHYLNSFSSEDQSAYFWRVKSDGRQIYDYTEIDKDGNETLVSKSATNYDTQPCILLQPKPEDLVYTCNRTIENSFQASPSGNFKYFTYSIRENFYSYSTGNSRTAKSLDTLNWGTNSNQVVANFTGENYYTTKILSVNNNGTAIIQVEKYDPSFSIKFLKVSSTGVVSTVRSGNSYPWQVQINDLENVFFCEGGRIFTIKNDGNWIEVATMTNDYNITKLTWFNALNVATPEHPEGIVYYRKTPTQFFSTQDGLIMDVSSYGFIYAFSVNDDQKFVLTAVNPPYSIVNSAVFTGPDLVKDKFIESGDTFKGETVLYPVAGGLNNNLDFYVYYDGRENPYHYSLSQNNNVYVKASLKPQTCKVADKGVTVKFWSQLDPAWNKAGEYYANVAPGKMKDWGCNTSVNAMLLDAYGLRTMPDGTPTNPGTLNKNLATYLKGTAYPYGVGYTPSSQVSYDGVVAAARRGWLNTCSLSLDECLTEANSKISYKGTMAVNTMTAVETKAIEDEICGGNPVILRLTKTIDSSKTHFVLATGFDYFDDPNHPGQKTKSFIFNDVGRLDADRGENKDFTIPAYSKKYKLAGYRLYKQAADPPMIFAYGSDNIQFVVTDPAGKMNGFNPITNISYNQNPDGRYYHESVSNPASESDVDTDTTLVEGFNFENTKSVIEGTYKFEVYGVKDGVYNLTIYSDDKNGNRNNGTNFSGTILKGETKVLRHIASSVVAPVANKKISMAAAIFQNSVRLKNRGQVYFIGKVENFDMSGFNSSSNFNISIGSIADYNKVVPISNFRHFLGFSYYAENGVAVYLYKNGDFLISINNVNLDDTEQSKWGILQIGFGANIGNVDISLRCQKYSCVMK